MTAMVAARSPRFFVLTGGDAAGKSTLLDIVAALRQDWAVGGLAPDTWLPQPALPHLDCYLHRHPRDVIHTLEPAARATTLLQLIHSHYEYWIKPNLHAGKVVLVDSYFYRFYVKERLRGIVPDFFYRALDGMPDADAVFLARLPPAIAFKRRSEFCVHEVYARASEADFVRFQTDVLHGLDELCSRRGRELIAVDAARTPDELAADLIARIEALMQAQAPLPVAARQLP